MWQPEIIKGKFQDISAMFQVQNVETFIYFYFELLEILICHVIFLQKDSRTYGTPTVRSDLPAPRMRRTGDTTNYGDSSTARDLLFPSVHSAHGVFEEHLLCSRTKKEV